MAEREASMPPAPAPTRSCHVLLVEDDHDLRDALTDALTRAGHRVSPVADGDAALRAIQTTRPDVIVLDLMMPTMDGWQFRVEQKRDPAIARIPVVAMSASASSTAAAVDADLYLRKPVDARTLVRAIADVMEARARLDEPARHAESERIAALGTLAAGVAHEVNNPLTYVLLHLAHATRLLANVQGEENRAVVEKIETLLRGAHEGAERIRHVTGGIRAFSRSEELARSPIDVHHVLDAAIELVRADIRIRARLVKVYGATPIVLANEGRLAQVFLHLLTNALQAIGEGQGEHTIRVVTSTDRHGRATIEINDDGEGVPEHLAARIFEPFFSTRPVGQGAGLGLSIAQGIVNALGGELTLRRETRGTTFAVALPAAYSGGVRPTATGAPRRVLVVDHESSTGPSVRDAISDEHEVVCVTNGRAGLVATEGTAFDVILCDLDLPDISGMEFLAALRAQRPEHVKRVVFVSRDPTSDWAARARATGCRVLAKPLLDEALGALLSPIGTPGTAS